MGQTDQEDPPVPPQESPESNTAGSGPALHRSTRPHNSLWYLKGD